jgi:bifunctional non-homologous end joining protein LigD
VPCQSALIDHVPAGPNWSHELKWDGYRIIARKEGAKVRLWSRNGRSWHLAFPHLFAAVAALPVSGLVLDGEAVMLRADGSADFHALRSTSARTEARLIVFDLLEVDGQDMRLLPLEERRAHLAAVLNGKSPFLVFSEAMGGERGGVLFRHACERGLEGIVSKRKGSAYVSGGTRTWRKIRCPGYTRAGEGA